MYERDAGERRAVLLKPNSVEQNFKLQSPRPSPDRLVRPVTTNIGV